MDIELLENEITITCNSFMEGMIEKNRPFVPSIVCGGDGSMLRDQIRQNFQYDNKKSYDKTKNSIIYIYHPGALIRNGYDIRNWTTLCPHHDINKISAFGCQCPYTKPIDIKHLDEIMYDNGNMYMIDDFETFKLSKNITSLIGTTEKANQILKNYSYCYKYSNVIPMISLLIAKELGFKYIYLIGCDGQRFDVHFYDKFTGRSSIDNQDTNFKEKYYGGVIKGMHERKIELDNSNINIISCFETVYDFIYTCNINDYININQLKKTNNIIDSYHKYVLSSYYTNEKEYLEQIKKTIIDKYKYISTCIIIGNQIDIDKLDLNIFNGCPIISYNKKCKQPIIMCSDEYDIIKQHIDNENNREIYYIFNPLYYIFNTYDLERKKYKDNKSIVSLQTYVNSNNNVFLIEVLDKLKLTKKIDIIKNEENLKNNQIFNSKFSNTQLFMAIKIAKSVGINNIFLLGCSVDITLDSQRVNENIFFGNLQSNISHSLNQNKNLHNINLDKLLVDKKGVLMDKLINYASISKLTYDMNMRVIIDAIENILTGKNESPLHDYIYIRQ
jgi:hypothetical protein